MPHDPFYLSPAWNKLRAKHLARHPLCVRCGRKARHVDHILSRSVASHLALDPSNLQSLCHSDHNRLTAAYDMGRLHGACDAEGNTLDPSHPWAQRSNAEAITVANRTDWVPTIEAARMKADYARKLRRGRGPGGLFGV